MAIIELLIIMIVLLSLFGAPVLIRSLRDCSADRIDIADTDLYDDLDLDRYVVLWLERLVLGVAVYCMAASSHYNLYKPAANMAVVKI